MTNKELLEDLLIEFDELGMEPTTIVPNPSERAIRWKRELMCAIEHLGAEWISVDERLPDENGRFLTVDKKGDMMVCYWEKHFGWFAMVCNKNAITHWMPLPEPPDMKGGE